MLRIAVLVAICGGVLLVPSAAFAEQRCKYQSPWDEPWPRLSHVRAEHMSCTYANALAADYERRWRKHDRPPRKVNAGGPWYYCRYRLVTGEQTSYGVVKCARGRRVMRGRIYS